MKTFLNLVAAIGALVAPLYLTGCNQDSGAQPNAGAVGSPGLTASPRPTNTTLLRDGFPPMSYVLGSGGKLRIMDATAKEELFADQVAPQSIILVDAKKGVVNGTQTLVKGPLAPNHKYELWLDQ